MQNPDAHAAAGLIHADTVNPLMPSYDVPESATDALCVDPLNVTAWSTVSEASAFAFGASTHGDDTTRANIDAATSSIDVALDARERKEQETWVNVVVWW